MTRFKEQEKSYDEWFLDSGCSNHMRGDGELFAILNKDFKHSVKLGNDKRLQVTRIGSVKVLLQGT